jgi:hypothetical protein
VHVDAGEVAPSWPRRVRARYREQGLQVKRSNPDVRILDTAVLSDEKRAAAVVVLRNPPRARPGAAAGADRRPGRRRQVAVSQRRAGPGALAGLRPALGGGRTSIWVNDQVVAERQAATRRGADRLPRGKAPRKVPKLRVQGVRIERQDTTGLAARGFVRNESRIEQRDLVLHGIARKGERIVAAGRGQIRRARPGRRASFRMFFIGDPATPSSSSASPRPIALEDPWRRPHLPPPTARWAARPVSTARRARRRWPATSSTA